MIKSQFPTTLAFLFSFFCLDYFCLMSVKNILLRALEQGSDISKDTWYIASVSLYRQKYSAFILHF
jgi:hypothetical protein